RTQRRTQAGAGLQGFPCVLPCPLELCGMRRIHEYQPCHFGWVEACEKQSIRASERVPGAYVRPVLAGLDERYVQVLAYALAVERARVGITPHDPRPAVGARAGR